MGKSNCMLMDYGIAFNDNLKKMAALFLQTLPDFKLQEIILECVQKTKLSFVFSKFFKIYLFFPGFILKINL